MDKRNEKKKAPERFGAEAAEAFAEGMGLTGTGPTGTGPVGPGPVGTGPTGPHFPGSFPTETTALAPTVRAGFTEVGRGRLSPIVLGAESVQFTNPAMERKEE